MHLTCKTTSLIVEWVLLVAKLHQETPLLPLLSLKKSIDDQSTCALDAQNPLLANLKMNKLLTIRCRWQQDLISSQKGLLSSVLDSGTEHWISLCSSHLMQRWRRTQKIWKVCKLQGRWTKRCILFYLCIKAKGRQKYTDPLIWIENCVLYINPLPASL